MGADGATRCETCPMGSAETRTPTALVTGASRGIGRATAIALARAGVDVAVTARTMHEGDGIDVSDAGQGRPVPGSLDVTAREIESLARRALPVVADLLDAASLIAAVDRVLEAWGRIDILVNNAADTGPGSMVPFLELTIEQLERKLAANVVSQAVVIKAVLPSMIEAGGGVIIDVSSHVATGDPPAAVGSGGWGLAYAASKAAFHRFAPLLALELAPFGIRTHNVDPGYVETERQLVNAAALGLEGRYRGAPPSVPGAVMAWLATSPEAVALNGQTVHAQRVALERGLHPDWRLVLRGGRENRRRRTGDAGQVALPEGLLVRSGNVGVEVLVCLPAFVETECIALIDILSPPVLEASGVFTTQGGDLGNTGEDVISIVGGEAE